MSDDLKFSERIVMGALGPAGDILVNGLRKAFDEIQELRSRLQALEQNTTPARPAEQKLSNYGPPISAPELWANALQAGASKKPREYWLIAGAIFTDKAKAYAKSRELFEPQPAPIHVREVL